MSFSTKAGDAGRLEKLYSYHKSCVFGALDSLHRDGWLPLLTDSKFSAPNKGGDSKSESRGTGSIGKSTAFSSIGDSRIPVVSGTRESVGITAHDGFALQRSHDSQLEDYVLLGRSMLDARSTAEMLIEELKAEVSYYEHLHVPSYI